MNVVRRIVLVGDAGVGKTALFSAYADQTYNPEHLTTMGVDFRHVHVRVGNQPIKLQLWDTAGHERYRSITNTYYRSANLIILVFDVGNRASFVSLSDWIRVIEVTAYVPIIIVGNKADMEKGKREVSEAEGRAFAEVHGFPYLEASARTAYNLTEAFEGWLHSTLATQSTDTVKATIILHREKPHKKGFWGYC